MCTGKGKKRKILKMHAFILKNKRLIHKVWIKSSPGVRSAPPPGGRITDGQGGCSTQGKQLSISCSLAEATELIHLQEALGQHRMRFFRTHRVVKCN